MISSLRAGTCTRQLASVCARSSSRRAMSSLSPWHTAGEAEERNREIGDEGLGAMGSLLGLEEPQPTSSRQTRSNVRPPPTPTSAPAFRLNSVDEAFAGETQRALTPAPPPTERQLNSTYVAPFEDPLLAFFTNMVMKHGERTKAQRIVTRALLHIHAVTRAPALPAFREAVMQASPSVKNVSQRKGAQNIILPGPLNERQRIHFGIKWMLEASQKRGEKTLEERIAWEVIDILQGSSAVLSKKRQVHEQATLNRGNVVVRRAP